MSNTYFSFFITFIAGLSTLGGFFIIFIKKANHDSIIVSSLSFAAGVMICTSIIDLIPESINLIDETCSSICTITISFLGLLFGIVISMIIDYFIPDINFDANNNSLFRVGLLSMIAIIMHNIPEGIATFMASSSNISLGISLAFAIAMHNIPEGITISIPIYYSTGNKKKAFIYTLISAISEPFGALLAFIFLKNIINDFILGVLLSLIAGVMLEISFRTLLPSTKKYSNYKRVIVSFLIGFFIMLISIFI